MKLHNYQTDAVTFIKARFQGSHPGAAVFADPGLGKTLISLESINVLDPLTPESRRCKRNSKNPLTSKHLVIAPLRPLLSTWETESRKWGFNYAFHNLRSPKGLEALRNDEPGVYLINPESLKKLANEKFRGFGVCVVDESTKFKNWSSQRSKVLRKLRKKLGFFILLSGTPAPNSNTDLFSQCFFLDEGKTFGTSLMRFRYRWCRQGGFQGRQWIFDDRQAEKFQELLAPMAIRLDCETYLDMPELLVNDIWVDLPPRARRQYDDMEQRLFAELDNDESLTASNASAVYAKCRQMANGAVYNDDGEVTQVHTAKAEALADLKEELAGKPLLTAFQFKHDKGAIAGDGFIDGSVTPREVNSTIEAWNAGQLGILGLQSASSHGLNIQKGGCSDIAWYGLTNAFEDYAQTNFRIYRQGNDAKQVRIHRILARNTVDEQVLDTLQCKDTSQRGILEAIKRYRERKS